MPISKWRACSLTVALTLLMAGCDQNDRSRLTRIAQKVSERSEVLVGIKDGAILKGWEAWPGKVDGESLEVRVDKRLRWDKSLEGLTIHVVAADGTIELKGKVKEDAQKQRATELAQATLGVVQVKDLLEVDKPDQ